MSERDDDRIFVGGSSCDTSEHQLQVALVVEAQMPTDTEHVDDGIVGQKGQDKDNPTIDPYIGMEFSTHEKAYDFYNAYAKRKGFGIRRGHTEWSRKKDVCLTRMFVCDKEGYKYMKDKREEGKDVNRQADTRVGCKARMVIGLDKESGNWIVRKFDGDHIGHTLTTPSKVMKHHSHQKLHRAPVCKKLIDSLDGKGLRPSTICKVVNAAYEGEDDYLSMRQCQDRLKIKRKSNIGQECALIIQYFQNKMASDPQFYFAMELDLDQSMRSVFWADGRARTSYLQFGDVVSFDCTYKTNNLSLPFAPFTGVNHHRQSTLFGCALLADESQETFTWLFNEWLKCMSGIAPSTIITDQDKAMCPAIHKVFPQTRHRYCSWHLQKNAIQNIQSMQSMHGEQISAEYKKWYWSSTEEKFMERWEEMQSKYELDGKNWLTQLYNHRDHWVPVFLKNIFTAGMTSTQRSEGINAYFDGYVNSQTKLHEFINQYENAVGARRAVELEADFKSANSIPILSTSHLIEKQARDCYTRHMFDIFQEEFKENGSMFHKKLSKDASIITYDVWPMIENDESKIRHELVVFDTSQEITITCTCAKFEMEGILCKHCLHILVKKQVSTIPEKYIMRRWTKDARHVGRGVVRSSHTKSECQLSIIKHWALRAKCNKALEGATLANMFHDELENMIDEFNEKVEIYKEKKEKEGDGRVDASNKMPISTILVSPEQATQITIRDPNGPVVTKGRPGQASRIKSGIEISQEKYIKKQRTCGYCKQKGHYITGCPLAKLNKAGIQEEQGGKM